MSLRAKRSASQLVIASVARHVIASVARQSVVSTTIALPQSPYRNRPRHSSLRAKRSVARQSVVSTAIVFTTIALVAIVYCSNLGNKYSLDLYINFIIQKMVIAFGVPILNNCKTGTNHSYFIRQEIQRTQGMIHIAVL